MYNKGKYYSENILFKLYILMCVNTHNVKCLSYCELQLKKKTKTESHDQVYPSGWCPSLLLRAWFLNIHLNPTGDDEFIYLCNRWFYVQL